MNAAVTTHYEVSRLGVKVDINNPRQRDVLAGGFYKNSVYLLPNILPKRDAFRENIALDCGAPSV